MKKILNHKKTLIISLVIVAILLSCGAVYAWGLSPITPSAPVSEALKAGDVCDDHLVQHCVECDGYEIQETAKYCPDCNKQMTLCCSGLLVTDDYEHWCTMRTSHPSNCILQQDLYKTAYVCMDCKYVQYGTANDTHIESYHHTNCTCSSYCMNNAYCYYPKLRDIIVQWETYSTENNELFGSPDMPDKPHDPVAAGDYCEIHDKFACDLDHFE